MKVKPCEGFHLGFFIGIAIATEAFMFHNLDHMAMWSGRREFVKWQGKAGREGSLLLLLQWNKYAQPSPSSVS